MSASRQLSPEDLCNAIEDLGIHRGDTLMVHTDTMILTPLPPMPMGERLRILLECLQGVLGTEGTLIVPTFTYSFCKNQVYDIQDSPCSGVGIFSEFVRAQSSCRRSRDPILSVGVLGPKAELYCSKEVIDCHGQGSIFEDLYQDNVKLACLGCSLDRTTFIHYVERKHGVEYRYNKRFAGTIRDALGNESSHQVDYLVRDYDLKLTTDLSRLRKELAEKGQLTQVKFGRVGLYCTKAQDFYRQSCAILDDDSRGVVKHDVTLE